MRSLLWSGEFIWWYIMIAGNWDTRYRSVEDATVLLVDDDPSLLDFVSEMLRIEGYAVIAAREGGEALHLLRSGHTPDLIVSDVVMAGMDGYQFCAAVRSNPEWVLIPFIFLTACVQHSEIRRTYNLCADAYLLKPFEAEDLLQAIQTRLRRIREVRKATEASVLQTKQRLIATLSHELRTPLTYVYGYVNMLRESHGNLDTFTVGRMLDGINVGAERLVELVEDLMLVAQLDSGVIAPEVEQGRTLSSFDKIVHNVLPKYQLRAAEHKVMLEVRIPSGLKVSCVPTYLQNAFERLIDNAIRFCQCEGGRVVISVWEQDGELFIAVQDNGIGIVPEAQEQIFERFEQLDRHKQEQQGLGLGLTIARQLIRLHGGDIRVESQPGEGSTFTITLPMEADRIVDA